MSASLPEDPRAFLPNAFIPSSAATRGAAIDRIVHHSVITEFDVPSYRTAEAQEQARGAAPKGPQAQKKNNRKGRALPIEAPARILLRHARHAVRHIRKSRKRKTQNE